MSLEPKHIAEFLSELIGNHMDACKLAGGGNRSHIFEAGGSADIFAYTPDDDGNVLIILKDGQGVFEVSIKKSKPSEFDMLRDLLQRYDDTYAETIDTPFRKKDRALTALWWMTENVNDDTPHRSDIYHFVRAIVREAQDA